ncbi:hypothetical protein SPBR_00666 [Sporothrix brasiliensis 5110]|uniref:Uncharacterized protein n=1 Tax=Sporothrix brasiliensis 5110 TaxID=1398154 RepID=A0A0C2IU71_9PEZI|nr:uncharacterized protein SPBR_00666 [Sporothrix brasiliensis 5110]KIH90320.1 hypothetical protein SPBR_00666 [Sporothrix brasiliensis 5110]
MFFHLQYIHLFRPFLKYTPKASPLPAHVSPRRICTSNASAISKLMRLYKKVYNLRQICNIAVYMIHSACTIHLLNLPEKTAKRNIIHGVKQLEEMAEDWLCARRTLSIISVLARKWGVELPDEASQVLQRSDEKYGTVSTADVPSPNLSVGSAVGPHGSGNSPQHIQAFGSANVEGGGGTSPSAAARNAAVKSEQLVAGSLAITAMPGLLEQFSQQSPTYQDFSTPGVTPEYLSGLPKANSPIAGAVAPVSKQPSYSQNTAGPSGGPSAVSVGGSVPSVSTWSMDPAVTQSMQGYEHAQLAYHQPTSQPDMPSNMYGVDGQDWFLKEGVSWQHNFETWGFPQQRQQGPVSPTNPQQQQQQQQQSDRVRQAHPQQQMSRSRNHTPTSTENNSTPISDSSLFMFRGPQGSDLDMTFDGLATTGGNLDGLGPV